MQIEDPEPTPFVRATAITKSFAGNRVLDAVHLDCHGGQIHALLGANGAGKSTLIQILTGVYRPDGGAVAVRGERVRFRAPADAERAGIAAVYQELSLVDELTVAQNVWLGREPRRGLRVDRRELYRRCGELFDRFQLDLDPHADVSRLSLARRQLVELAKALSRDAKLVILDEPTAALTSDEQQRLFAILADLKARDIAILYVSHRLEEIFQIADVVTVLRDGRLVANAPLAEMTRDGVIETMVGSRPEAVRPQRDPTAPDRRTGSPILELRGLSSRKFKDVSLQLWPGEILGIAGLIGSGRTSLLSTLFGASRTTEGTVLLDGKPLDLRSVRSAVGSGVALVTEDRKRTGLATELAIEQNLTAVRLPGRVGFYNRVRARRLARGAASEVSLVGDVRRQTRRLSGGNQQKVVVGKWLAAQPHVLLCDEPTRGIDVGARSDLYRLFRDLADSGIGLLIASSDLDEILTVTDRVLVMSRGRLVAEFATADATEEGLMRAATGADAPDDDRSGPGSWIVTV